MNAQVGNKAHDGPADGVFLGDPPGFGCDGQLPAEVLGTRRQLKQFVAEIGVAVKDKRPQDRVVLLAVTPAEQRQPASATLDGGSQRDRQE